MLGKLPTERNPSISQNKYLHVLEKPVNMRYKCLPVCLSYLRTCSLGEKPPLWVIWPNVPCCLCKGYRLRMHMHNQFFFFFLKKTQLHVPGDRARSRRQFTLLRIDFSVITVTFSNLGSELLPETCSLRSAKLHSSHVWSADNLPESVLPFCHVSPGY